ncbi:hypothetical protein SELMODRAFT_416366 [Selaginella moellendorffii]|uniref:Uncharacterized protein n=1 Tax=Selaginella moellendorffii TaxID=88036 RepID=D8RZ23_SELML|nr:hypothetical protein SELMODRAFT_416366 [Selaginella moellendorffii]
MKAILLVEWMEVQLEPPLGGNKPHLVLLVIHTYQHTGLARIFNRMEPLLAFQAPLYVLVYSAIAVDTAKGFLLFDWRGESWFWTGYCLYFVLNVIAPCQGWVDLCHQATDKEEEEDDEEETDGAQAQAAVGKDPKVVMLIFMITLVCAILIWIEMGDNETVAEIYSDMLAIVIFLSGGGLAGYGMRVPFGTKTKKIQTFCNSADVFPTRSLLILVYNASPEVIPCVVVLWVMRNNPSRLSSTQSRRSVTSVSGYQQALAQEQALLQQWIVPDDMESMIVASSRSRRSKSGRVADSSEDAYRKHAKWQFDTMSKRDAKAFIERITSGKKTLLSAKKHTHTIWDSAEMDVTLALCHITHLSDVERSACAGTLGWDGAREQLDCMVDFARHQLLSTGSAGIVSLGSLEQDEEVSEPSFATIVIQKFLRLYPSFLFPFARRCQAQPMPIFWHEKFSFSLSAEMTMASNYKSGLGSACVAPVPRLLGLISRVLKADFFLILPVDRLGWNMLSGKVGSQDRVRRAYPQLALHAADPPRLRTFSDEKESAPLRVKDLSEKLVHFSGDGRLGTEDVTEEEEAEVLRNGFCKERITSLIGQTIKSYTVESMWYVIEIPSDRLERHTYRKADGIVQSQMNMNLSS